MKCPACKGSGDQKVILGDDEMEEMCTVCEGEGTYPECPKCNGAGYYGWNHTCEECQGVGYVRLTQDEIDNELQRKGEEADEQRMVQ